MSDRPSIEEMMHLCHSLKGTNLRTRTEDDVRDQMLQLVRGHTFMAITRSAEQVWYRSRKCESEEGFSNISQMIYPANGSPSYGRANLPAQPVLYASWNIRTAMEEVSLELGDTIQLIALRVQPGLQIPFHVVGEFQSVVNSGRSLINSVNLEAEIQRRFLGDPSGENVSLLIDSFIADQYRQIVKHPTEYKFSALFADHFCKDERGIIYPSVAANPGVNVAIPRLIFDSSFEVLFTEVIRIEKYYGYGVCEPKRLKATCQIANDGMFMWDSTQGFNFEWSLGAGMRLPSSFCGWRVASN